MFGNTGLYVATPDLTRGVEVKSTTARLLRSKLVAEKIFVNETMHNQTKWQLYTRFIQAGFLSQVIESYQVMVMEPR